MITAIFNNKMDYTIAYGLWQWDYGQVLRIKGIDFSQFAIEIQFSFNEDDEDSTIAVGVVKEVEYESTIIDGNETIVTSETVQVLDVPIPKDFLWNKNKRNYIIYVFLHLSNEETGHTIKKILLPVKVKPRPAYPYASKDEELFHSAIEQINNIYTDIKAQTDIVIESMEEWEDLKNYIEEFKGDYETDEAEIGTVWTKTENGAEFKPVTAEGSLDYELTINKPSIESVLLIGNKTFSDFGFEECSNEDILAMFQE